MNGKGFRMPLSRPVLGLAILSEARKWLLGAAGSPIVHVTQTSASRQVARDVLCAAFGWLYGVVERLEAIEKALESLHERSLPNCCLKPVSDS
jgi:hypothetical protein